MSEDRHLDGNALGGLLMEVFGREMTDVRGCCGHCRRVTRLGAMILYGGGPGQVLRCPHCETVVLVATSRPDGPRFYFSQLSWMQTSA